MEEFAALYRITYNFLNVNKCKNNAHASWCSMQGTKIVAYTKTSGCRNEGLYCAEVGCEPAKVRATNELSEHEQKQVSRPTITLWVEVIWNRHRITSHPLARTADLFACSTRAVALARSQERGSYQLYASISVPTHCAPTFCSFACLSHGGAEVAR